MLGWLSVLKRMVFTMNETQDEREKKANAEMKTLFEKWTKEDKKEREEKKKLGIKANRLDGNFEADEAQNTLRYKEIQAIRQKYGIPEP